MFQSKNVSLWHCWQKLHNFFHADDLVSFFEKKSVFDFEFEFKFQSKAMLFLTFLLIVDSITDGLST